MLNLMLRRLPITLAQLKEANNSQKKIKNKKVTIILLVLFKKINQNNLK